jgi:hypothetical protein
MILAFGIVNIPTIPGIYRGISELQMITKAGKTKRKILAVILHNGQHQISIVITDIHWPVGEKRLAQTAGAGDQP